MASLNYSAPSTSHAPRCRGEFAAVVIGNHRLCRDHYRLVLRLENFPPSHPGQFVEILAPLQAMDSDSHEIEWDFGRPRPPLRDQFLAADLPYLRRPFSIAGRRDGPGMAYTDIDIIHRVVGKATGILEHQRPGDKLSILGPLGNGFRVSERVKNALLVGGGVGIPPMIYLAEKLARRGMNVVAFAGAQSWDLVSLTLRPDFAVPADLLPVMAAAEFSAFGVPVVLATDDGTLGFHGYVTAALDAYLRCHAELRSEQTVVYCCGPTPMMRSTSVVAGKFDLSCQVSLEQPMACGMGTCQSCVIKYRPADAADWVYKLTCTDGPVFDSRDIIWP